jgi:hypothetical protein
MTLTQTYTKDLDGKTPADRDHAVGTGSIGDDLMPNGAGGTTLIRHLKEDAAEVVKTAATGAQHTYEDAKSVANGYLAAIGKEVVAKPVQSVAIAFATGAILSLLMNRR